MIHVIVTHAAAGWLAWLLAYLAHSTLWIAGAALACAGGHWLAPRTRNLLWKMALVGPLLSLGVAAAGGGAWAVHSVRLRPPAPAAGAADLMPGAAVSAGDLDAGADTALSSTSTWVTPSLAAWPWVALAGALALLRMAALGRNAWRLRRRLAGRRPVTDGRLLAVLARLRPTGLRGPLRLTVCDGITSPVALWRGEICVPPRIVQLDGDALAAVLAHEIAHLERRDNAWLACAAALEAVLFVQPLNRLARRALQESAELAADARAVEMTGDPEGLARSLAEVAAWGFEGRAAALVSPIVSSRGALLRRVERLLGGRTAAARGTRVAGALSVVGLGLLGLLAPAVAFEPPPVVSGGPLARAQEAPSSAAQPAPVPPRAASRPGVAREPRAPRRRPPLAAATTATLGDEPRAALTLAAPAAATPASSPAAAAPATPPPARAAAFVLVDEAGRATASNAGSEDLRDALAARAQAKDEYLWVRRGDQRLVIPGGPQLAALRAVGEEQGRGVRRQKELAQAQAELGEGQSRLGGAQAELGQQQSQLGLAQAAVGARQAELRGRRIQKDIDLSHDAAKSRPTLADLATQMAMRDERLRGEQLRLGQKQRELGQKQRELGDKQRELGGRQRELGQKQRELRQKDLELRKRLGDAVECITDEALADGTARVLSADPPAR